MLIITNTDIMGTLIILQISLPGMTYEGDPHPDTAVCPMPGTQEPGSPHTVFTSTSKQVVKH